MVFSSTEHRLSTKKVTEIWVQAGGDPETTPLCLEVIAREIRIINIRVIRIGVKHSSRFVRLDTEVKLHNSLRQGACRGLLKLKQHLVDC